MVKSGLICYLAKAAVSKNLLTMVSEELLYTGASQYAHESHGDLVKMKIPILVPGSGRGA